MFVRLFVDENLDRMIPISKQPKEKIQAIIDSCTRQFPEFSERARKRLRTYLKSCRRNKKAREGWENTVSFAICIKMSLEWNSKFCFSHLKIKTRPTPAHLTSVQAEQILALACENESMNAKRMRIGLEPISQGVQSQNTTVSFSLIQLYFVFIKRCLFNFRMEIQYCHLHCSLVFNPKSTPILTHLPYLLLQMFLSHLQML